MTTPNRRGPRPPIAAVILAAPVEPELLADLVRTYRTARAEDTIVGGADRERVPATRATVPQTAATPVFAIAARHGRCGSASAAAYGSERDSNRSAGACSSSNSGVALATRGRLLSAQGGIYLSQVRR